MTHRTRTRLFLRLSGHARDPLPLYESMYVCSVRNAYTSFNLTVYLYTAYWTERKRNESRFHGEDDSTTLRETYRRPNLPSRF